VIACHVNSLFSNNIILAQMKALAYVVNFFPIEINIAIKVSFITWYFSSEVV